MSLASFLTQSPAVNSQGTQSGSSSLPSWYNDYVSGILSNAAQWAGQGYNPFPGPQVAGLTPDQQKSYQTVQGQQGVGSGIAQQGVNQLTNTLQQPNAAQAGNPYLQQSQQGINSALQMPNASQAASPYLNSAATPLNQQMGNFMNPYIQDVVNANNTISNRNFTENVLPALQDQFTAAGQVGGGTQQGEYAARAARDLQLNQGMTNANTLAQGFNTALGGAEAQSGIYSNLGNTAGSLANSAQGTGLYGAGLTGSLGSTAGGLANAAQNTGISGAQAYGQLGTTVQNNALNQAAIQNQMGSQQQGQTQANYNAAMQNFQNQNNYPLTVAQGMGSALNGVQVPGATSQYAYNSPQAGYGNSPLTNAYSTYQGLSSLISPFLSARGGPVRMAKGGRVQLKLKPRSPLQRAVLSHDR